MLKNATKYIRKILSKNNEKEYVNEVFNKFSTAEVSTELISIMMLTQNPILIKILSGIQNNETIGRVSKIIVSLSYTIVRNN